MKVFSDEFKRVAVQKMLSRGNRTIESLCKEIGASSHSLYKWRQHYGSTVVMQPNDRTPQSLSAPEKMKAVMEFESLPAEKQGEFLRGKGFMTEHLTKWKSVWERALELGVEEPGFSRAEKSELLKRVKELEADVRRKDRALAETTALLVLKKKADLIWGTPDELA